MSEPYFFHIENDYSKIEEVFKKIGIKKILLVCGRSFEKTRLREYLSAISKNGCAEFVRFSEYRVNPDITSVFKAKEVFIDNGCQGILAVGGGSAIDLSKCLRLSLSEAREGTRLSPVPFFAVPTIAGSGSEVTGFAVIYSKDEKLSVAHNICIPDVVFYDSRLLETLPLAQRISSYTDALCHCIESLWSVNSTAASILFAESALKLLLEYREPYLLNQPLGNQKLQTAAKNAGKAINISKTTAAHAMSYRLTKLYGVPHGISAGLCLEQVWKHIILNKKQCCDVRGEKHLDMVLSLIDKCFGCQRHEESLELYRQILKSFSLPKIKAKSADDRLLLANSVNAERLKNSPVPISKAQLKEMYEKIIC